MSEIPASAEAMYDQAVAIAEKHLEAAVEEGKELGPYVAVMMIEAAVNQAADVIGHEDLIEWLRDLADQVEADMEEESEDK